MHSTRPFQSFAASLLFALALMAFAGSVPEFRAEAGDLSSALRQTGECSDPGWAPAAFGLKDHSVFKFNGEYYMVSINVPDERYFAYGRSADLCTWEDLGPVLQGRTPGSWDELVIWAPYVYEEGGVYYLYYTGVTDQFTQSILLATSTNPADPAAWSVQGVVFQPNHTGMVWQAGQWADNRDPVVIKSGGLYYMYYTGADVQGPVIGLATAAAPAGPWQDWGATLRLPSGSGMPESPMVFSSDGYFYLLYNQTGLGERIRVGPGPGGPWSRDTALHPGWAHEVWTGLAGELFTSYLLGYSVTIAPLGWDGFYDPPLPYIGSPPQHLLLPYLAR